MADISEKNVTRRVAIAGGRIHLGAEAFTLLMEGKLPKGDPLAMAEIAGIQAAKQTPSLIPLCHPLRLTGIEVTFSSDDQKKSVTAKCHPFEKK